VKGKRKDGKSHHKNPSLGKSYPYPHQNWSTMMVGNLLPRLNSSAQKNMYQIHQGMIRKHHEVSTKNHP